MKIFVTGASGYIGGSIAEKLRDSDHQVLGLVTSEEKARLLKERVYFIPTCLSRARHRPLFRITARAMDCKIPGSTKTSSRSP
jgi:nucleoside-diphosphate-sugar epimerase